ncbi:VOC family protein [Isobaculum melis]|uniref:Catechol 2,3-dioxygenase n=1 Tax=Isobaculum melis TaxID=142588 RepID=A0A1H9PPH4_9LACT|nr:VOC family protein [Isobaculum melis]SER49970.1 Catechol 2,3-dioxygenase [Isobaculum melis]
MITGLHHISALTKSATENLNFYTKVLGLRLVKNTVNQSNTKMRHLFYGDYQGTPGTLLTFFEVPNLGHSYLRKSYFETVYLGIPKGSLNWWKQWLEKNEVVITVMEDSLSIQDADGFQMRLVEIDEVLATDHTVIQQKIPRERQIIRILGVAVFVPSPEDTTQTLVDWLGLTVIKGNELVDPLGRSFTAIYDSFGKEPTRAGRGTIDHIAYQVATKDEVDALYEKAKQLDLTIELFVDRGYFKSLYVRDSSGLRIEVASDEPGFLVDESLETLGSKLALPPFLEEQRAEIEKGLQN